MIISHVQWRRILGFRFEVFLNLPTFPLNIMASPTIIFGNYTATGFNRLLFFRKYPAVLHRHFSSVETLQEHNQSINFILCEVKIGHLVQNPFGSKGKRFFQFGFNPGLPGMRNMRVAEFQFHNHFSAKRR